MRQFLPALTALALGATAVLAQNIEVIGERKEHFKEMGEAVKPIAAMFKGEQSFELAKVQSVVKLIQEKTDVLPDLFPDDARTGEETRALPAIWDNKADFETRWKKLAESAKAAEPAITDETTFRPVWKELVGNCSGCHKNYRQPKD